MPPADAVAALPSLGSDRNPSRLRFWQGTGINFGSVMIKTGVGGGGGTGHDTWPNQTSERSPQVTILGDHAH